MRRILIAAAVLLLGSAPLAEALAQAAPRPSQPRQQAQPQQGPNFTLRNEGSRVLREFYASPPNQNGWGDDKLGADMVQPGATFRVQLPRGAACTQDLKAVYDDNSEVERRGVDICRERTQAFTNPQADTQFVLLNRSPRTVFQLFMRAEGGDDWGPDRLGAGTIETDARETIAFSSGGAGCSFDMRVVFDNDSAEERKAVDVCATPVVVIIPGWTTSDSMPEEGAQPASPSAPGGATARPEPPRGGASFRNQGSAPLVRLSIDPPGTTTAGPDRLGDGVIAPGASLDITPPDGLCTADITAVFRDGNRVRRAGVALCDGAEVALP